MTVCMDSVVLRSELWDRLVGIAGSAPSWVHGCSLGNEHPDLHHTAVGYRGGHLWWLRWSGGADAELVALAPCPNTACLLFGGHDGAHRGQDPVPADVATGRHSRAPQSTPAANTAATKGAAASNGRLPGAAPTEPGSAQVETPRSARRADGGSVGDKDSAGEIARALWALAAAVDRLADARTGGPHIDHDRRGQESLGGL